MFGFLKIKKADRSVVAAVSGELIPIEAVEDDVFSQKMMGEGYGINPSSGEIFSPVAGTVTTIFPTKHAIGITTPEGLEVLVHMGLDTVEMNGEPFEEKIEKDVVVGTDTLLAKMNVDQVVASGRKPTVVVVYTNMDKLKDFPDISAQPAPVQHGDVLGSLLYK